MDERQLKKLLKNFLDEDGKLTQYPSKYKYKILSLLYLSSKFEINKKYTEKQVNEHLQIWHTFDDWAMLRRDMYDKKFFGREKDCSVYWLEENQPSPQDFGLEEFS